MGSDISRMRFDSLKDFGGLALQQGRLLLDAEFNEYVAMLDRRLRAESSDLTSFGPDPNHAGVAWVPRLTPDAFRVTASGGALTIGRGRMYVDGLLAENHGTGAMGFDDLLSEPTRTADTPYDQQPYWKTPDALPSGGPHLAYLDVWQREVTHLEDPSLIEVAVGVDTASRLQTVWQVRLLPEAGSGACTADDADLGQAWLDIIQPSGGRLTTATIEIDPTDDPCELPPSGGYRGLENQTYRVEIHDGGPAGSATFKWSRDNASVAMAVVEMVSTTELRLATLGRDDVLRISNNDWVEILDDHREFNQVAGVMRKVTVDDATRTISFTGALPADMQPADATDLAARHLRVRCWDQAGVVVDGTGATVEDLNDVGSDGVITVPSAATTQIVLEHGIVVSFSVDGPSNRFRPGDFWVFAARSADTSVELLDEAPPRGIHHHIARLGTVTFPASQTDCRRLWPPLDTGGDACGDCTVCLTPESHTSGALTLQAAVDLIGETGGTICLAPGIYDVGAGVAIDGARSLRIRGQGLLTMLVSQGTALTITSTFGITIENMAIIGGAQAPAAVAMKTVMGATIQETAILSFGNPDVQSSAIEVSGAAVMVAIRRNVLIGQVGIDGTGQQETGVFAGDLAVEDNIIGAVRGIDLGGRSLYLLSCRIDSNEIVTGGGNALTATGLVAPGGSLDVTSNKILTTGTGITVGPDATAADNTVSTFGENRGADGIVVTEGGFPAPPGHIRITGNRVHDRLGRGIALETPVSTIMVKQNILSDVGAGIVMDAKAVAEHVAIDNNVITRVEGGKATGGSVFGIAIVNAGAATIGTNSVTQVGLENVEGTARVGILALACADVHMAGNRVTDIGRLEGYVGNAAGIAVVGPFERATVAENSVSFSGEISGPKEGTWSAVYIASSLDERGIFGDKAAVETDKGAIVINESWAFAVESRGAHSTLSSNTVSGGGRQPTCLVLTHGDLVATANQCSHEGEIIAMYLGAQSVAASSNRVRGGDSMLVIDTAENRFSAVGNLAAGGTHLGGPGNMLPAPWDVLNPVVS
jgi:hypothetical protein